MNSFLSACSANSQSARRRLVPSTRIPFTSHNGTCCNASAQQVVAGLTRSRMMITMMPSRRIVTAVAGRSGHVGCRKALLSTARTSSAAPIPSGADQPSGNNSRVWEVTVSSILSLTTSLALVWAFPTTDKGISRAEGAGHEALLYTSVPSPRAATLAKGQPEPKATAISRNKPETSSSQRRMYDVRFLCCSNVGLLLGATRSSQ